MRLERIVGRAGGKPFRWLAAGVFLLFLFLNCLSAFPALHHFFHPDSDEADHHCAVTMLIQGKVETTSVDVPLVVPQEIVELPAPAAISVFSASLDLLPPGRAPPPFA